jgi:hypothetical protein
MRLVSTINQKLKLGFILLFISSSVIAQQNSPFSRYGLGDLSPSQNIVNRAMGGVAVSYVDAQSVNFYNPASYSAHRVVTFDVGVTIDSRTLRSENPIKKYNATNFTPAYVAVGLPLNRKRNLGLAFGLRPLSAINYSIEQRKRIPGIDSVGNIFEGEGGLYQLYTGVGKRWGGFSVGVNVGYNFGRKQINTRTLFLNDTVEYAQTNVATTTTYGRAFINGGMQYYFAAGKNSFVRLGAAARFKQTFNAEQDLLKETFQYSATGISTRIDSVFESTGKKGSIVIPATYTAGIMLQNTILDRLGNRLDKSMFGVEYETSKWSEFRFYGAQDKVTDAWQLRLGAQFTPDPLSITSYWNRVNYRVGFYTGRDYANPDGKELPVKGFTFGAGLPLRKWRSFDNQFTIINTAIEIGKRGNKNNNITESFFRVSFGLALSDIWFIKRRYD